MEIGLCGMIGFFVPLSLQEEGLLSLDMQLFLLVLPLGILVWPIVF